MDQALSLLAFIIECIGWIGSIAIVVLGVMFARDVTQTRHAIRRNFPVLGRMRYFLEQQGVYFRQYFFAHDRQELPFNRATRNWVYGAAKGLGGIVGFGSTNDLREPGSIIFVNSPFARMEDEQCFDCSMIIGPDTRQPFKARHIVNISGMSYGALSAPAVRALSIGAARAGVWLNTGEGGLSPYHLEGGGDLIFQIGTAKYGVHNEAGKLCDERLRELATQVQAFEIKLAQGAKPGKGGMLPGIKVSEEIASIRGIPIGEDSISPNRHPEIETPDDLLDMIEHVRDVSGRPVGIKTVIGSEIYPRMLCEHIVARGMASAPDFITLDGGDGGSAAAPQALADHVGLPLNESLPMLVDTLAEYGLRERIKVIASGKLVTPVKVAWALCAGADLVNTARGFLFSLGCIQSMQCHQNSCPTGITTHNKRMQRGLVVADKAARVAAYAERINKDINMIAHSCGLMDARHFGREHARIVLSAGHSQPMGKLYPDRNAISLGRC
ncbi:MAG: FMN-binding glutamate synthase family protein [Mariprofundaceae bacterium]